MFRNNDIQITAEDGDNVFPNFESVSSKVYDKNIYNDLNTLYTDKKEVPIAINSDMKNEIILPQETLLEKYKNVDYANFTLEPKKTQDTLNVDTHVSGQGHVGGQDNLKFYNLPAPKEYMQSNPPRNIEKFEDTNSQCKDLDCDLYVKHILECSRCKAMVTKQLGIDNDKIRNEEIMEVVSYIVFGLFILLLIDSLKKNKN